MEGCDSMRRLNERPRSKLRGITAVIYILSAKQASRNLPEEIKSKINLTFWSIVLGVVSAVTVQAAPTITGFKPSNGTIGDNVIITGTDFIFPNLSSNKVRFNGVPATVIKASSAANLEVTVPLGANTGPITIDNSKGSVKSSYSFEVPLGKNPIASSGIIPGPGDRKELETFLSGFMMADGSDSKVYYAPPKAILWVDKKEDKDGYVNVHFVCGFNTSVCDRSNNYINNSKTGPYKDGNIVDIKVEYKIEAAKLKD
jgi:hypothetical protein